MQRANWASSRSSMVAKCWLTSAALVSGHRCSAGCNSGEYGGSNSRCACSGTRSLTLVGFQPARSSSSTSCLVGLAPAWRANSASSTSKRGMLTVVARWKTVRPEAGGTKPTTGAPGKAVRHGGDGPLPDRGPDAAQQGFEATTLFVGRPHSPQLDLGVGEGRGHGLQQRPYFFCA